MMRMEERNEVTPDGIVISLEFFDHFTSFKILATLY